MFRNVASPTPLRAQRAANNHPQHMMGHPPQVTRTWLRRREGHRALCWEWGCNVGTVGGGVRDGLHVLRHCGARAMQFYGDTTQTLSVSTLTSTTQ
jgi:hypothetical protein